MSEHLPNLLPELVAMSAARGHKPRILLLYGSTRQRSFSRMLVEEAARLLEHFGAETRVFNPSGLPLPDDAPSDHPKVQELLALMQWSEGQVWCSPERHGAMSGVFKTQIDWVPLAIGAVRPTQGKILALMQVCGGSQSFGNPPGNQYSSEVEFSPNRIKEILREDIAFFGQPNHRHPQAS